MTAATIPVLSHRAEVARLLREKARDLPILGAIKRRNIALDRLFHDVVSLSESEFDIPVEETNLEGSILVVHPKGPNDGRLVRMYASHADLCAAPGWWLGRFAIAGVGSPDLGAAAAHEMAKAIRIITTGAVVEPPSGFDDAAQFLGALDRFGGLNSRLDQEHVRGPDAWHHVNTALPYHMSVRDVLKRADG